MRANRRMLAIATAGAVATAAGPAAVLAATAHHSASLNADSHGALKFNKRKLTVAHGGVTIRMHNPKSSGLQHGIAIQGSGVKKSGGIVNPGKVATLKVTLRPGRYTFYCPVPGHRQSGMRGTLIVK